MRKSYPGRSFPLGARVLPYGVNFSVYSRSSTAMQLLLFNTPDDPQPAEVIDLDPRVNRTYHFWHIFLPGIRPGQVYAYRASGPYNPSAGLRFDSQKVLLDPYARAVAFPVEYDRGAAVFPGDNTLHAMKSVVVDPAKYDWKGDLPLHRPFTHTVIYEMHLAGFTRHSNSAVSDGKRGTYAGLVEKIPYLKELGVTAVELMPVFAFDPQDAPSGMSNYWGYSPINFFAPHPFYSSDPAPLGALDEFRGMVRALHKAGIEVILDVVYNHTAEGGNGGPTLSFRGLENETYYILEDDKTYYANYTGTGNTLNT
ncbi:MAG TPA: alpha-amylase family glycosyl hydrolase, partial [Anaerolinea sp.]|nr:alpha-amylase family glycosyl hydrolase [Anaerolinea sp.]